MVHIRSFFENKNVFITGGLGFVGKLVVEKLLRSCPKISSINLLVRSKNNAPPEERFYGYIQEPVFKRLRETNPSFGKKLFFCSGDLTLPSLGLKRNDANKLVDETEVVIHVASTVNFSAPILESLETNYFGTKRVLDLSSQMKRLSSFVYVSTAYANADKNFVEEKVYPTLQTYESVELMKSKLLEMNQKERKAFEIKALGAFPNTYTFTKNLAESLVSECKNRVPAVIVRPSVVGSALEEPEPGFIDNFFAATGVFYMLASKEVPYYFANLENRVDIVPADLCVNSILAAAAARAKENPGKLLVYHSTADEKYTYGSMNGSIRKACKDIPLQNISGMWGLTGRFVQSRTIVVGGFIILKFIPALILDLVCYPITQEKFRRLKICVFLYQKLFLFDRITSHKWDFKRNNMLALLDSMNSEEKQIFPLKSKKSWNVDDFMRLYVEGIRNFTARSQKSKK